MAKDYKYKLLFREMARPPRREAPPPALSAAAAPDKPQAVPDAPTASPVLPELMAEPAFDFAPVPPEPDEEPAAKPATTPAAQPEASPVVETAPLPPALEPPPAQHEQTGADSTATPEPEPEPEPAPDVAPVATPEPEPNAAVSEPPAPESPAEPTAMPEPEPEPEPELTIAAPEPTPPAALPETNAAEPAPAPPPAAPPRHEPPPARAAEQDRPTMPDGIRLPRVLLTNDDGIDAPGLQVLAEVAATFADEVWIIAPEHDQSGTSMSLALHHPRRIYRRGARSLAVSGSPADCIALASYMLRAEPPALVLSGINAGQNVGDDANLSGTLGAALTALTLGIPSIAISQCYAQHRDNINWETARTRLPALLQELLAQGWPKDHCLSINIPPLPPEAVTEALWTRQAPRTISGYVVDVRTDLRGFDYCWLNITRPDKPAPEDTDLWAIEQGCISISCLSLDRSRPVPPESISLTGDED